ncbi:glutamate racemase [Polaromonas jejuensis]|uniref:Glutamate racemase n=1 Tax=Polaromonas jejuensis TaxID=457502 RepID=A0ABW0QGY4_9BURK|nr:glutamate racemase [Polaromonas jejuensis]
MSTGSQAIGVFDSGIGGLSILKALRTELPHENFIYVADSGHAPYGEREDCFVVARSRAIARHLLTQQHLKVKALVIACNTATAAAIHLLREEHPDLTIIGVEPALKPAVAHSQTRRIGVMATRGTLASAKFKALLGSLVGQAEFILQPCDGLAEAIERSVESGDATKTEALCAQYTTAMGIFGSEKGEIDSLVLGCTHYPFASAQLRDLLGPQVQFLDTGAPVARQTRLRLAAAAGEPDTRQAAIYPPAALASHPAGHIRLFTTGQPAALQAASQHWLQIDATVEALAF